MGPVYRFQAPVGVKSRGGHWIGQGWEIVKSNLGLFMGMSLLYLVLSSCIPLVLHGPLLAGLHIACMRKIVRGKMEIGDMFKGFQFFVPTLLAALVMSAFIFVGSLFCIIPGLVVAAMYQFTYLFIVDKKMDFWQAMQASHAVVKNDYVGFTLFLVGAMLLNFLGFLCLIIGLLVTFPIVYAAITVAYKEVVGFEPGTV